MAVAAPLIACLSACRAAVGVLFSALRCVATTWRMSPFFILPTNTPPLRFPNDRNHRDTALDFHRVAFVGG